MESTTEPTQAAPVDPLGEPYPPGTPWWWIIADRRAGRLIKGAFVLGSSLVTVAPALYEMLPDFKANVPSSLFHWITSAIGGLMLLGGAWHAVQTAKRIKEST